MVGWGGGLNLPWAEGVKFSLSRSFSLFLVIYAIALYYAYINFLKLEPGRLGREACYVSPLYTLYKLQGAKMHSAFVTSLSFYNLHSFNGTPIVQNNCYQTLLIGE